MGSFRQIQALSGFGFRGLGFRVWGIGFRVHPSADVDPAKNPRKAKDAGAEIRGFSGGRFRPGKGTETTTLRTGLVFGAVFQRVSMQFEFRLQGTSGFL